MSDLQRYPLNLCLRNNEEDIVFILEQEINSDIVLLCFFSNSLQVTLIDKKEKILKKKF